MRLLKFDHFFEAANINRDYMKCLWIQLNMISLAQLELNNNIQMIKLAKLPITSSQAIFKDRKTKTQKEKKIKKLKNIKYC
jgi:hypothetical protein